MQNENDKKFMQIALEEAKLAAAIGEIPVGAVVVHGNDLLAKAHNMRETDADPTAHAEIVAMRSAAKTLNKWRLSDCTIYVTLEPCVMCAGAMVNARIGRCVVGAIDKKAGALDSIYALGDDPRLNHSFPISYGVLEDECVQVLDEFFAKTRSTRV